MGAFNRVVGSLLNNKAGYIENIYRYNDSFADFAIEVLNFDENNMLLHDRDLIDDSEVDLADRRRQFLDLFQNSLIPTRDTNSLIYMDRCNG